MPNVEYVDVAEIVGRRAARAEQRRKVQVEYEGYVLGLTADNAGKMVIAPGEKFSLVRDRLRSAAKRLDVHLKIQRRNGAIYFRRVDAPPVSRATSTEADSA